MALNQFFDILLNNNTETVNKVREKLQCHESLVIISDEILSYSNPQFSLQWRFCVLVQKEPVELFDYLLKLDQSLTIDPHSILYPAVN